MKNKLSKLLKHRQIKDVVQDKRTINELNQAFILDFTSSFKEELEKQGLTDIGVNDLIHSIRAYRLSNHYQGVGGVHFWNFVVDVVFVDGSSLLIESYQNNYVTVLEYFPEFAEISARMER
ncbi:MULTISPECIES: hypothetical protein [Lactococcus]|uniref:Uncharacterized protein n=2 Tax=Lactococcus TaxID=1357 RepID=A0A387BK19_9LACT|nr:MULTISPECIES: hypothetical protein [Lactococcus]AYG01310.1 hypothetical protein D7I46_09510 [Lactococcus allomyrinae]QDK70751.1 hypothetical protein FLP15_05765 [Lactococcus protaetiae]